MQGDGRGEAAVKELADLLECPESEILRVSAKSGMGVASVLEGIVKSIPPPEDAIPNEKLRAMAFDSWYDSFRGVVSLVAVVEGEIKKGKTHALQSLVIVRLALTNSRKLCRRLNHVNNDEIKLRRVGSRDPVSARNQHREPSDTGRPKVTERDGGMDRVRNERGQRWSVF